MNQQDFNLKLNEHIRACNIFSEIWATEMIILSLSNFEILYVSDSFTQLTGITNEDVKSLQREIFTRLLHPKELPTIIKAHTKTILFYTKLYQKENNSPYVDAHYHVKLRKHTGDYTDYCILIHPISFSETGYPLLAYALLLPSCKSGFEKFSIAVKSNDKKLYYSSLADKYVQKKNLELKEVEIEILKLTAKGHGENKIAKLLNIKLDLVRYYKKNIYKKFHVSSMAEAVYIALHNRII
ncbi:MAG: Transcriptional regulator [Bacteroidetes bacterium]|nr:Transcriptional regulator [Bacteroidota bacterium]